MSVNHQKDVVLIINRMRNEINLTIGPFERLNWETAALVRSSLRTSFSFSIGIFPIISFFFAAHKAYLQAFHVSIQQLNLIIDKFHFQNVN